MSATTDRQRPPSVDAVARALASSGLPHPICVDIARAAIADGDVESAPARAEAYRRTLLTPVINATGVLLHTNLGRAPVRHHQDAAAFTVEFDLATGARGSRQPRSASCSPGCAEPRPRWWSTTTPLPSARARRAGRGSRRAGEPGRERRDRRRVPCARGDGAVGRPSRRRRHHQPHELDDYRRAIERPGADVALVLKVHPSNYRVEGFVEETSVAELATLGVPVVADIGSGLLDATCPWLPGAPPAVARRRASRGTDAGRWRGPRHVQRRQALRRPAGRDHRRALGHWSSAASAIRWPVRCVPAAWCWQPSRTLRWPTSTSAPSPTWRSGRWSPPRSPPSANVPQAMVAAISEVQRPRQRCRWIRCPVRDRRRVSRCRRTAWRSPATCSTSCAGTIRR
jgi:hypothetical protein